MADHQFQPGSSWWSSAAAPCRPDVVSLPAMPSFVSCSTVLGRSLDYCDEMTTSQSPSVSNSSVTFQGHPSVLTTAGLPMDHFPSQEWNHGPFCGARSEHNFHGLPQENVMMTISGVNIDMDGSSFSSTTNSINPLRNPMSLAFLEDHSDSIIINPLVPPSFAPPYAFLHGLNLEQDGGSSQTSFEEDRTIRLTAEQEQQQQLQFSNETFFWNPITVAAGTEHHALRPPPPPPLPLHNQSSNGGYNSSLLKTSSNSGINASMESRKSSEPSLKKTRIEAPSATFKVRKEKLGDRITALQQLVSPFGKTDTASVLHEAIEYIKFLHNQVRVLSAPYLKNGHPVPQMKDPEKSKECVAQNQDLRSRGLCLVPISSTFAVANEIPTDFWTPTFMGGGFS
ncbi:transcription factor bHLH112-like isoform X1 [Zingiber officinale]|uniref:transcription factor bHLH112-like isoform X1 n=1 Tax=Zingiber officinale TaxID=94328 RepID=UPI001C4B4344|nr:transcription factor bHLH112-like isoform X1 [Zingiber officinale]